MGQWVPFWVCFPPQPRRSRYRFGGPTARQKQNSAQRFFRKKLAGKSGKSGVPICLMAFGFELGDFEPNVLFEGVGVGTR